MIASIKNFLKEKVLQFKNDKTKLWKIITMISIVLFLLAVFFFLKQIRCPKSPEPLRQETSVVAEKKASSSPNCQNCIRRRLDGVWVEADKSNLPLIAIMIDNHPSARPAKGLEKASLIYEAEVEGNYTRYMAIYATNEKIDRIGPVRSARGYFVDWAGELNAVYAHCGGSPDALVKISQKALVDLNEFYNGQYFWRSSDKEAPHNILTSSDNLNKYLENKKISSGDYSAWKFKDDKPLLENGPTSSEISINYNHPNFKVKWSYNRASNDYLRYLEDAPQITADNNTINAKNILIQYIPAEVVDAKLRLDMEATGQGKAIICLDGECREGEWEKEKFSTRTKFYYQGGKEAELNAGQTWVEVVRPEVEVSY